MAEEMAAHSSSEVVENASEDEKRGSADNWDGDSHRDRDSGDSASGGVYPCLYTWIASADAAARNRPPVETPTHSW